MKTPMKLLLALVAILIALSSTAVFAKNNNQNDDDDDVSTLKGQLVRVGDKNRFKYSYPKWNISMNPFSLIMGTYGASVSYAVNPNIALRADFNYSDGFDDGATGVETGISAPIYFRKAYDDWFIEPGLMFQQTSSKEYDDSGLATGTVRSTAFGPQVTLGHHWMWDSGFNVAWGLGVGRNVGYDKDVASRASRFFGTGYLRFGYAF